MLEPMRSLRNQLLEGIPSSVESRIQLAVLYRAIGHPEQAGRWAIGIDGVGTEWEISAYAALLVATEGELEPALRRLSRVSASEQLGTDARAVLSQAIAQRSAMTSETGWRSTIRTITGATSAALAAFTVLVVVVLPLLITVWALSGAEGVSALARTGALIVVFLVAFTAGWATPYFAVARRPVLALISAVVAVALGTVFALWAPTPGLPSFWDR